MKRSYYLIAAVVLAVAGGFTLFNGHKKDRPPSQSLPAEPAVAAAEPNGLPPLASGPYADLPHVDTPSDSLLVIPATAPVVPKPTPEPAELAIPAATPLPALPEVPAGLPKPEGSVSIPSVPVVPAPPIVPMDSGPAALPIPGFAAGSPPNSNPAFNPIPTVPVAPSPPVPTVPLQPTDSSTLSSATPVSVPSNSKFLILRGKVPESSHGSRLLVELMSSKFIEIEGIASTDNVKVIVRQGAIVRTIPKVEIVFAGQTRDDVYRFVRDRVEKTDAVARLFVARWCMFNGMREQALLEAREIVRFQPENRAARELAQSLEASLKQFPADGNPAAATKPAAFAEAEVEVTPEAATSFASRVQPILANLCVECHARTDYTGGFKLAKIEGYEPGPQTTRTNLRAVAGQLRKADPLNSPFLAKSAVAHGGLRQPPFLSRQVPGYRVLEGWVLEAVGPGTTNGTSVLPAAANDIRPGMLPAPPAGPGLPPVESGSTLPPVPPPVVTVPTVPALPPVPGISTPPPVITVPAVLPTPPTMTPMVQSQPPVVPTPMSSLPSVPTVPQPAGSQFGTGAGPQPGPPMPAAGRDEFDPTPFNTKR